MEPVLVSTPTDNVVELAGRSVVLSYGSVADEYAALHRRAVIVDHGHRGRMRISGAKAAEMVTGMVTNDVTALPPGHGCYAVALTAKGRIVADLRIYMEADGVFIDAPARAAAGWFDMVRKFVNPRIAPYRDETESMCAVGIHGADARHVIEAMTGSPATALATLPPYGHVTIELNGAPMLVAHVPEFESSGVDGYEIYAPAGQREVLWELAVAAHAMPAGLTAWEIARVEAGRPEWGVDMDDNTIPQEANMDDLHAISYTKGCYVGQEVVARVHFRGHVNRHLRGLQCADAPPPTGAVLFTADAREVGDVRSTATSPRFGSIAIAMVRREVEAGTELTARWEGGEGRVTVRALPFTA